MMVLAESDLLLLGQIRMELNLIDHGLDPGVFQQIHQMIDVEIAHTDRPDLFLMIQFLQRPPIPLAPELAHPGGAHRLAAQLQAGKNDRLHPQGGQHLQHRLVV